MEMDLVRIAVAIEIAPEHNGILVGAGNRRQLGLECGTFDLAAAAEGFSERKTIELRQILQVARLMRGEATAQHGGDGKQNSKRNSTHFHRPPGIGALSGIGPV